MAQNQISTGEPPFASGMPASVLPRLEGIFASQRYTAGSLIFSEGDAVDRVFLIQQGRVGLEMYLPGRGRRRIMSLGPGDLLGWSPALGANCMVATALAIEDCQLAVAEAEKLRRLCETDFEVGYYFMRQLAHVLSQRLIATRLQLLDLFKQESTASTSSEAVP